LLDRFEAKDLDARLDLRRYKPALRDGRPVEQSIVILFDFNLE
jgi:hypothetical protein